MDLEQVRSTYAESKRSFDAVCINIETLQKQQEALQESINEINLEVEVLEHTSDVLKILFETVKKKSVESIEKLVTHALNSVWESDYEFKITTHERGTLSTNRFTLYKDGNESDIIDGHGGGVVNIVAFILRLIFTLRMSDQLRPVLILDEPFAFVSENYHDKIGQLLLELIDKLDIEIIMVSHQPTIKKYANKMYELEDSSLGVLVKDVTDTTH